MRLSIVVHFVALAIVFAASLVLCRRKASSPEVLMAFGSGTVLVVEGLSFAAVLHLVPDSWLYYLGIGLPMGAGDLGWIVFAAGFLWFAIGGRRERTAA